MVPSFTGCSAKKSTALTGVPNTVPALIPAATESLPQNQMAETLTRSKWQSAGDQGTNVTAEVVIWQFYSNGMFRRQLISDFSEERMGAWSISPGSAKSGVIYLASSNGATELEVLSLKFENGRLILGEFPYEESAFTGTDMPPAVVEAYLQAVTGQRNSNFSLWETITARNWQTEAPSPGDASLYSFMPDGTFTAHFDATQCQYSGTWSVSSSPGQNNGTIRLRVPANSCDPRGAQDTFVREMPIKLNGKSL